jgi:hypothetical protein
MSVFPDVARLQPMPDSLNVILKNTYFKDGILESGSLIKIRVDYVMDIPLLVFKFQEPYYDFLQILKNEKSILSNQEWLNKDQISIKLVISDPVITDRLTYREFILSVAESSRLKEQLDLQQHIPGEQIGEIENYVHSRKEKFLW